ncbi:unnamed protein product [Brachionus calyciflorus]|uniref:Integrase catalytic domain-containing protein n=1 Tax=Brachionus calyciflorus TaxID=104777 RepID=A0A814BF89_9BILA|nr:unnamed protein product [Brachionus calyciflorus]
MVDGWCCHLGIPEQILSDGGKQFQSKLIDLVYEYLDISRLKTTLFQPQCDGQSERTIQTIKNMIKANIDVDQKNSDLCVNQLAFAYNSSVHASTNQTPFEMMYRRKPRIPIDIIFPNTEISNRLPVLKEFKIINELGEVTVLEDHNDLIESNLPKIATEYLEELNAKLKVSYEIAAKNRNLKMHKAKIDFYRNIKKFKYVTIQS